MKTYLQLFALELQINKNENLTAKEKDVLRLATFYSCLGSVNIDSKTCKVFIYSFLGAREILV